MSSSVVLSVCLSVCLYVCAGTRNPKCLAVSYADIKCFGEYSAFVKCKVTR